MVMNTAWYANLTDLRRALGLTAAQTADDALLGDLLEASTRLIEAHTGRWFAPVMATRLYSFVASDYVPLDADLLKLNGITHPGGAIALSDVHLEPLNAAVKTLITLDPGAVALTHSGDPVGAVGVVAVWGFHPTWNTAWIVSDQSVDDDPLTSAAQTLTVLDSAPFSVGNLLSIEGEYLRVLAVNTDTHTLTVARGVNGSNAAEHARETPISIYAPPADVRQACLRLASWLYRQKDVGFAQAMGGLRGQAIVPSALPEDVQQILMPYVRIRVS